MTSRAFKLGGIIALALLPAVAAEAMARRPGVVAFGTAPLPAWVTTGDGSLKVPKDQLRFSWLGTAAFEIRSATTTLLFDPYFSRPSLGTLLAGPLHPDEAAVRKYLKPVDAVFVGHSHFDHVLDAPLSAKLTGATLYGSASTLEIARQEGLADAQRAPVTDGSIVRVGDFEVEVVETKHNDLPTQWLAGGMLGTDFKLPMGFLSYKNDAVYGFFIRWRGRSIYHAGSTELPDAKVAGKHADLVLLCLSGWKSNPTIFKRLDTAFKPAVLVPMHHDDFFKPFEAGFTEGLLAFHQEAMGVIRHDLPGTAVLPVSFFDDHRVRAKD